MPKLKVTLPEAGEVTHELVDELVTVGRTSENLIQIEDASVSSRHAQLALGSGGNYALKDLNSTNGTRINGAATVEAQLRNGDRVRFGQIECAYFSDDTTAAEPLPDAAEPDAAIPAESRWPTNFANASPFQKKSRAVDPVGKYILIFAALAVLLFLVALGFVFTLPGPRPDMDLTPLGLPTLQAPRRELEPVSADPAHPFWRDIAPVALRDNGGASAPALATRVRTAWDGREWRVLFEADDAHPWATLTTRDAALWDEEVVEVFIDPVGDLESYFEIEINPLGTVCDLVLRRTASGWRKDFAWDVEGLVRTVRRTPSGWAAELAIPFDAISNAPPEPGTRWRVNFLRIDRPGGAGTEADLSAWSPTGIRNFHRPAHFGTVEFVRS